MRVKLLPVLLLLAVAPFPGHGEDLMDAYRQAVANDPVLATADAHRLLVAEGVPVARAALLPQLSAGLEMDQIHSGGSSQTTSGNGNIVQTGGGGHVRDRSLTGNLSQPIIDLSAIANLRAAHAARDAQEQVYQAALQNLYVRVANAYFNVLVSRDMVDINRAYEDGVGRTGPLLIVVPPLRRRPKFIAAVIKPPAVRRQTGRARRFTD